MMKKLTALVVLFTLLITSCVSKKEFVALQTKHDATKDELLTVETS